MIFSCISGLRFERGVWGDINCRTKKNLRFGRDGRWACGKRAQKNNTVLESEEYATLERES